MKPGNHGGGRGLHTWVVAIVVLGILVTGYLLFFYGHLIGHRVSEHLESALRPAFYMARVDRHETAGSDRKEEVTGTPTRILQPDHRTRAVALRNVQPGVVERAFTQSVLAEHLISPDSLAVHPLSGTIYVSEEDASSITRIIQRSAQRVIGPDTPIYAYEGEERIRTRPLRLPEGIAFGPDGDLYAVEDTVGGRLIRFAMHATEDYPEGEVVPIPGGWHTFAWEGLDVGPHGEILMAGSDIEYVARQETMGVFSGAILYRDREGAWWIPYRRFFASFSEVRFSKSMNQAVYACEVTGEIGWLDLNSRYTLGGHSAIAARSPEGIAILPDGTFLVAEEAGTIVHIDPASDRYIRVITGLSSVEGVIWDPVREQILVAEDGTGRVLAFEPDVAYDPYVDMLLYATYYPAFSQQNVPQECPEYLARILALGGLRFDSLDQNLVTFREFVARIPLVAADVRAIPMNPDRTIEDPITRIQFVIFEPNRMGRPTEGDSGNAFALFGLRQASGRLVTTSALPVIMMSAEAHEAKLTDHGDGYVTVPTASAVSVSGIGVAGVQFLGMGRTPDFSMVLNPRNPVDSYMVVFHADGERDHYRLESTGPHIRDNWVIGFTQFRHDEWTRLSYPPETTERIVRDVAFSSSELL